MAAIVVLGTIASVGGIDDAEGAGTDTPLQAGAGFEVPPQAASPSSTSPATPSRANPVDDPSG